MLSLHLLTQQLRAAAAEIPPLLLLLLLLLVVEMMMFVTHRDVILLRWCRRSSARSSCAGEDATNAENMCFYLCLFTRVGVKKRRPFFPSSL